jgi:hypothetical protein
MWHLSRDKVQQRVRRWGRKAVSAASAKFANVILRGLNGEKGVITPTFVKPESDLFTNHSIDFF